MTQQPEGDRRAARPPHCTQPSPVPAHRPRAGRAHAGPRPAPDDGCELTEEDREWARRAVAALPPLTSRQRDILAMLLRRHH